MAIKNPERTKRGKKSRASGARFERKVRDDLEEKGWIVDRWGNNVEFEEIKQEEIGDFRDDDLAVTMCSPIIKGRLVQAKAKYNPFTKSLMMSKGGFPDFIAVYSFPKKILGFDGKNIDNFKGYASLVIGVECKSNGYLDKTEREKCKWLLENNIFSKILIAFKSKKRGKIEYKEFK